MKIFELVNEVKKAIEESDETVASLLLLWCTYRAIDY